MWQKIEQARQPEPTYPILDLDCLDLTALPKEVTTLQGLEWFSASMNQLTGLPANKLLMVNFGFRDGETAAKALLIKTFDFALQVWDLNQRICLFCGRKAKY